MAEMIIPGTYISVRSEGLISAGRVATGIVGVVGTAASGPIGEPVTLASFANARELFGLPDDFARPADGTTPLTLVRALEQVYVNGASTVIAVRVAGSSAASASFAIVDATSRLVATLSALTPGTIGNDLRVRVNEASEPCRIEGESSSNVFDRLTYAPVVPSAQNQIRVIRGVSRRTDLFDIVYRRIVRDDRVSPGTGGRFFLANTPVTAVAGVNRVRVLNSDGSPVRDYGDGAIIYGAGAPPQVGEVRLINNAGNSELVFEASQVPSVTQRIVATYAVDHAAPEAGEVLLTEWDGTLAFAAGEAPAQANSDRLVASYLVDAASCVEVSLSYSATVERYTVPDGRVLAQRVNAASQLARAVAGTQHGDKRPATGAGGYFGTGSNTRGNDGADADADDYAGGLEQLAGMLVNIVVLAGQDAATMGSVLLGHLNSTETTDFERIGVIGAAGNTLADVLGNTVSSDRVVLVAPGLRYPDGRTLPATYTAAAVAGLIATLPVQGSLTNKVLNLPGLATQFNRGQQEQLIGRDVLAVVVRDGLRVLKGITTAGEGTPFSAIPTRRIVDYAKYGVRSASNPYIGRLNNSRVRSALKSTLDAFLTRMVDDEALTAYELEVTATRAQEIAGEVSVVMTIQPTFSIDFVRVVMNLK